MTYTFIVTRCSDLPVEQCCRVMKVSRAARSAASRTTDRADSRRPSARSVHASAAATSLSYTDTAALAVASTDFS